jgi:hypothetical protein
MAGTHSGRCRVGRSRCDAGGGARISLLHQGCDFGASAGDCSFSSLAQCQATASGRDAYCAANPYFNAKADMQTDRSRQHGRRF